MTGYLSIGQISTLIAFVVFVAGFFLPNAFALIWVRFLSKAPNATTWAFTQRALAASDWPTLLQKDSVSIDAVEWKVKWLSWARLGVITILAIAAVITPAGLYDQVIADSSLSPTPFMLAADRSAFGRGTLVHNSVPWRTCGGDWDGAFIQVPCPGDNQTFSIVSNATGNYQIWDGGVHQVAVKKNRVDIYQSGLANLGQTVSSFFDIKARRIRLATDNSIARFSEATPVTTFTYLKNAVAQDEIYAVDGLVVDARSGQIGFRNHTAPQNSPSGMTWQEDLLFAEADTSCADLGISIGFDIPYSSGSTSWMADDMPFSLIDDGGFANFDPEAKPQYTPASQDQLDLRNRAEVFSYWTRYWTMRHPSMNLSDPRTGEPDSSRSTIGRAILATSSGSYLGLSSTDSIAVFTQSGLMTAPFVRSSGSDNSTADRRLRDLYQDCNPWQQDEFVNLDMFPIRCGLLLGAAVQNDGTSVAIAREGMSMRRKMYSCASAVKLSIKTVQFRTNVTGSARLEDLKVDSIEPKRYGNTEEQPLWGMETPSNTFAGNIGQLWGLLSQEYANTPNISTSRASFFYPSYQMVGSASVSGAAKDGYLPASDGWDDVLSSTFSVNMGAYDNFRNGKGDISLLDRWQTFSRDADSASQIIRLLFADMAANFFTSGRSWLNQDIVPSPYSNVSEPIFEHLVPVQDYHRQVFFHWVYGIPAFITAALLLLLIPITILFAFTGSIATVSKFLPMLSAGRLLTSTESQGQYDQSYSKWANGPGTRKLAIQGWQWTFTSPSPRDSPSFNMDDDNTMHSDMENNSKRDYSAVSQHERQEPSPPNMRPASSYGPGPNSRSNF